MYGQSPPSAVTRRAIVSHLQRYMYVHEVLFNHLQDYDFPGRETDRLDMTLTVFTGLKNFQTSQIKGKETRTD